MNIPDRVCGYKIIYSDKITPVKEFGSDVKLVKISNVGKYSLITCLNIILKSNKSAYFHRIQYSLKDNYVYLYVLGDVNLKVWKKRKNFKDRDFTNKLDLLEEINDILMSKRVKDDDCVSVYDVGKILTRERMNFDFRVKTYLEKIYCKSDCKLFISDSAFDYKKKQLHIIKTLKYRDKYECNEEVVLGWKDSNLYVVKSDLNEEESRKIVDKYECIFLELFNLYLECDRLENQHSFCKRAVNSNFLVDISRYGVFIYDINNWYKRGFSLSRLSYNGEYSVDCRDNDVLSIIKGEEEDFLKKIMIKIDDCPEWMREELYKIRQKQLYKSLVFKNFKKLRLGI